MVYGADAGGGLWIFCLGNVYNVPSNGIAYNYDGDFSKSDGLVEFLKLTVYINKIS